MNRTDSTQNSGVIWKAELTSCTMPHNRHFEAFNLSIQQVDELLDDLYEVSGFILHIQGIGQGEIKRDNSLQALCELENIPERRSSNRLTLLRIETFWSLLYLLQGIFE